MIFFCFTREAGNQGSTEHNIRNFVAKFGDDINKLLFRSTAPHAAKNFVTCMLNRKIQIMTDLRLFFHNLNQLVVNFLRIAVKHPNPSDSLDLTEFLKKQVQSFSAVKVCAIYGGFLCYQNQLPDTLRCHIFGLFQKAFFRYAAEFATKGRDNAVSTVLITAFGNLEVAEMSSRGDYSAAAVFREFIDIAEFLEDITCLHFV